MNHEEAMAREPLCERLLAATLPPSSLTALAMLSLRELTTSWPARLLSLGCMVRPGPCAS